MDGVRSNPYLLGLGLGIISVIIYYVERKFIQGDEDIEVVNCLKLFILVSGMVITGLIISQKKNIVKTIKDEVPQLVEQTIHTGEPNF